MSGLRFHILTWKRQSPKRSLMFFHNVLGVMSESPNLRLSSLGSCHIIRIIPMKHYRSPNVVPITKGRTNGSNVGLIYFVRYRFLLLTVIYFSYWCRGCIPTYTCRTSCISSLSARLLSLCLFVTSRLSGENLHRWNCLLCMSPYIIRTTYMSWCRDLTPLIC
mgnify:CR=1 FL=1